MNKKLLFTTKGTLRKLGLTILGLSAISLSAQMSGSSYTIDASGSATSTNFQNWRSFWQALQNISRLDGGPSTGNGVSGPVTVTVLSDLTETAQIQFPVIAGTSSTNTITIDGNGKFVAFAGPYEVISFLGGDYFTIKNLTVRQTATSACIGIRFSNASDYNTITGCTIEFSALTTGSTAGSAYIAFAASSTAISTATAASNGSYCNISKNLFRTTNTNSPGPAFGVSLMGNTSNYSSTPVNNTVDGNTLQNFYYMGIINFYNNGNVISGNDISRANSSTNNVNISNLIPLYSAYNYATNRSTQISGNKVHDLPFVGATAAQGTSTSYGIYSWYNYGNASRPYLVKNNSWTNIRVNGTSYFGYMYYNDYMEVDGNTITSYNNNNGGSSYCYGWNIYYGQVLNFKNNIIEKCSTSTGYVYYTYFYNQSGTWNYCNDNIIRDNVAQNYSYVIYPYYGNWAVNRNKIQNNRINSSQGYIYAMAPYYSYNLIVNSNEITGNVGAYGVLGMYLNSYNSGSYTCEVRNNTIATNGATSQYPYHYAYGLYIYMYYHPDIRVTGNIVTTTGGYYAYPIYTYSANGAGAYKEWDANTYWVTNTSGQYWYTNGSGYGDWTGYAGGGFGGPNENYNDPKWKDAPNNDYRSTIWETQNNAPTDADNLTDINKAVRNPFKTDRGAAENFTDLSKVSTNFTVPASVCAGYTTSGATTITVQNNYATDTAEDFFVAYTINGGPKVREKSKPILTGQQGTITFANPIVLSKAGPTRIAIFIDVPDDDRSNDSFIFNTIVKPAPGGGRFTPSAKPTWAYYQNGKPNDVTVVGQPVIYDIAPPRIYNNSQYNQNPGWNASVWATTASGAAVSGATFVAPSGSTNLEYTFKTSNTNLEDSMITIYYKVTDNANGCDTTIKRNVLIYPTIAPDFAFPAKVCDGDDVEFINKSTVRSGNMEFKWDFGTGNPADTSQAPEPIFQFPKSGTYKVKMTAKTLPYGFPAWDSADVVVNKIPTVAFTKANACEGLNLVFTNKTVPATPTTYSWNFGDNTTSTLANPTKKYATTGQYTVTLKANLNGCIAETSQRAYQFDKPKADFKLASGTCDNESFVFENLSTIKSGLFGSYWDFSDANVSTEDEPTHMFSTPGTKNVKLVATSEFGCKDEKIVPVTVKESPKADFTNDPACSLTPTAFNNTTPAVALTNANYAWNFGDGGTSTAKSPSHSWSTLGPKMVKMTVTLDNGCKASVEKELFVGVQPKANFDAQNVCAGDPVVFENNTTWSQGNIDFDWNFGDATTSTNSDPQKTYNATATTTYNVTLKASIQGGCSDQVTKQVTVNEGPTTCSFVAAPDYAFGFYGMKLDPVNGSGTPGAQNGVVYTWVFTGGGTLSGPSAQYNFQEDGKYSVTMRAKVLATGCECTSTKEVVMSRTSAENLENMGVAVFPNPNNGQFSVALTESFGEQVSIDITNLSGAVVKTITTANNGLVTVDAGDVADGMYLVRVSSGSRVATSRINIRK